MTEQEKAANAIKLIESVNIKAGDAAAVVAILEWLQGIADGGE